jgi:acyl carrier protein
MSEVQVKICEFIAKEGSIPVEQVHTTSTLKDFNLESLDAVQIIFAIEEHFEIYLPYDNIDVDKQTVGDLVQIVEGLVREKQATS